MQIVLTVTELAERNTNIHSMSIIVIFVIVLVSKRLVLILKV